MSAKMKNKYFFQLIIKIYHENNIFNLNNSESK